MTTAKNPVKAVDTALQLVDIVDAHQPATLSEIATETDLTIGTVHNHLATLEQHDYVVRDDDQYRIGFRFLELGGRRRRQFDLYQHGRPVVDELASETGELANALAEENGRGVHVYLSEGENALLFDNFAGNRFSLHNSAVGKCILANMEDDRVDEIVNQQGLPASTEKTISTRSELDNARERIREQGYALDDQERLKGLRCVASPVLKKETIVGAISVSGPVSRFKDDRFRKELPELVMEKADMIGINLTYS